MNAAIALNARFYAHRPTGMQRYALELAARFAGRIDEVRPASALAGAKGHAWEQFYLPIAVGKRLLWSPNNTGPLAVRHQVCTIHDLITMDRPEWFNPRFAAWYGWLLPRLARRLPRLIAVSEFTKRRIVELCGVPDDRVTVIPNGVDPRFHAHGSDAISTARRQLGIPEGEYLLYVGSLEPRKNLGALVNAWRRVHDSLSRDLTLVIAGARGRSQIFAGAPDLQNLPPRTCLTGYVPDEHLPALYSGALAVVYPSLYEGFGLPPLEAMACGAPVITSRATSIPEVVGDAALLIDPARPDEIADAIQAVCSSPSMRETLRAAGLVRARSFTWERCAAETWATLQAVA